jgi:endonuclease V-like protein UPF0215 family
MSESSTLDTKSSKKKSSKEELASELANTKKKLKVLKQALKDEKVNTEKKNFALKTSIDDMESLKAQIAEKDKKYAQLL